MGCRLSTPPVPGPRVEGLPAMASGLPDAGVLGWDAGRGVPVLGCRRGAGCWRLRGDFWAAGRFERRLFEAAVRRWMGGSPGLGERWLVFHRAPAPHGEYAVEVFGEGLRLGVLELVPGRGWVLYPSGALASLLESSGAVEAVEVEARGRLKGKRLRLPRCPAGDGYVVVASGRWVGPARLEDGGGGDGPCTVRVRDMAPRGFRLLEGGGDLLDAVEANAEAVGALAAEARGFIRRVYASVMASRGRVYVALSGGADSTAVLSLAREALGAERVAAVYVDTGMEFPETRRHVERIASILGVDLEWVEAEADPLEEVKRRGIMTRDYRWCTRLLKLQPLRRFYERVGARLVLDGARSRESTGRAETPRLGENPLIPGVARALPIKHWSRLAVQLYLWERGLPILHLYQEGLTRIGCIACPAMHLYELHIAWRLHPEWFHRLAEAVASATGLTAGEALALLLRGEWRRGETRGGEPAAREETRAPPRSGASRA